MGGWSEEARKLAGIRLQERLANKSAEEQAEIRRKASETRRKNMEAKMIAGTDPNWLAKQHEAKPKLGRPKKGTNLDDLAQQMGFTSATEALLDMAVKRAGFASVQEAAMWAVKEKGRAKTDIVTATVGNWDDEG